MYQKGKCQDCGYISLRQPEGLQSPPDPMRMGVKEYFFMTYVEKSDKEIIGIYVYGFE
jgi:hypothetical protein